MTTTIKLCVGSGKNPKIIKVGPISIPESRVIKMYVSKQDMLLFAVDTVNG